MSRRTGTRKRVVAGAVVVSAKEYVDDRVSQSTRELSSEMRGLNAKIDGVNSKIDGAVLGLNAKIDGAVLGLNAKMDGLRAEFSGLNAKIEAILHVVTPTLAAVQQLSTDVALLKDMLAPRKPIGFRKDEIA